jgi:hypothetical protein
MTIKKRTIPSALALTLIFIVTQVYLGLAFAAAPRVVDTRVGPQQISGILTTQGNKTVTLNGASASTGATILNGAVIETPDGVTASINIPGHGVLTIAATSRVTLSLDQSGNIQVNLSQGCAVLHTNKGTTGEIDNTQGVIGKTNATKDGVIDACPTKAAGAAATTGGLSTGAKVTIAAAAVGGGATALALGLRGGNPSSSNP